jgi:hypothetical protein
MDGYTRLVDDNEALRGLIQRWRATGESSAQLLPVAARSLAATAHAKDRVLYPAIRRNVPDRAGFVDEAERINAHVFGFLAQALRLAPDGLGFVDQVHEAVAAADGLLLHERRDLLPAMHGADWSDGAASEYFTVRETLMAQEPLERLVASEERRSAPGGEH